VGIGGFHFRKLLEKTKIDINLLFIPIYVKVTMLEYNVINYYFDIYLLNEGNKAKQRMERDRDGGTKRNETKTRVVKNKIKYKPELYRHKENDAGKKFTYCV
jgi:hypothetical protein